MRAIPKHPYEHCKRIRGLNMGHIQRYALIWPLENPSMH